MKVESYKQGCTTLSAVCWGSTVSPYTQTDAVAVLARQQETTLREGKLARGGGRVILVILVQPALGEFHRFHFHLCLSLLPVVLLPERELGPELWRGSHHLAMEANLREGPVVKDAVLFFCQ